MALLSKIAKEKGLEENKLWAVSREQWAAKSQQYQRSRNQHCTSTTVTDEGDASIGVTHSS
jgi:hypothetical protein